MRENRQNRDSRAFRFRLSDKSTNDILQRIMSTARSSERDEVISFDLCDVSHLSARQHETQILGKQFAPPPSERGFLSAPLNGGMGEKRSPGWKINISALS